NRQDRRHRGLTFDPNPENRPLLRFIRFQMVADTHHIPVKSLLEEDRFTRLRTERKHFIDTVKMIAYRAESSLASLLREHIARPDDARALLRQIFDTEADLTPDTATN